jgi:hypothetical protein
MYKNAKELASHFCQVVENAEIDNIKRYIELAYLDEAKAMLAYDEYGVFRLFVRTGDEGYANYLIKLQLEALKSPEERKDAVLKMIGAMNSTLAIYAASASW